MAFLTGIYGKLTGAGLILLILALGTAYFHHKWYDEGVNSEKIALQKQIDTQTKRANAAEAKLLAKNTQALIPIQNTAALGVENLELALPPIQIVIAKATHDHPTFAAMRRPAPLVSVRAQQMRALAAQAAASAAAASGGTSTVPAARLGGAQSDARADGDL